MVAFANVVDAFVAFANVVDALLAFDQMLVVTDAA